MFPQETIFQDTLNELISSHKIFKDISVNVDVDTSINCTIIYHEDNNTIWYNPNFISILPQDQLYRAIALVLCFVKKQLFNQMENKNATVWSIASQYFFNNYLDKRNIGTPIAIDIFKDNFDGIALDEIYEELMQDFSHCDENFTKFYKFLENKVAKNIFMDISD